MMTHLVKKNSKKLMTGQTMIVRQLNATVSGIGIITEQSVSFLKREGVDRDLAKLSTPKFVVKIIECIIPV
jgi:hypothetical protein